ncbi:MAG: bifunctional phosphoribosylaminoimidazolecarboxamide formyltransferase/IMP cyclohydrolase [Planctomycetales bacterium]|nr:bifunctional phosphoribosylaminoimidazolecarboxamide formyltransferase/IMP cyclohydrolase [Planctomycetales bacterium]
MSSPKIERALISVSDKSGLAEFARALADAQVEIFSTGGTFRHLQEAGIPVIEISEYTKFPEMMDGRLKTLHPKVHGGILCRRDREDDMAAVGEHGIVGIELVVVNLYPFEATVTREGVTFDEAVEQIDIGGPTMVRAAAKNHEFVTIVTDAAQYGRVIEEMQQSGGATSLELRRELAGAAFERTATYDRAIANYFAGLKSDSDFPAAISPTFRLAEVLRYGENPHQQAALYASPQAASNRLVNAEKLNGKELSYNNLLDLDSAYKIARGLPGAAAAVLKHNNPCGAASADSLALATRRAFDGDPVSAFGSVLGFNQTVDLATAEVLAEPGRFVEAIIASDYEPAALELLKTKPKWKTNVRLLRLGEFPQSADPYEFRQIDGGLLLQQPDTLADDESQWRTVTEAQVADDLLAELRFAWAICRFVKSNAIVLCKDCSLVGAGAGQMSRVDSVEISIRKAGERTQGAVLASDAFFPFDDSIHEAAKAGIAAIIQPGGSKRDEEVIAACNQHGLPMIFTQRRHFRH